MTGGIDNGPAKEANAAGWREMIVSGRLEDAAVALAGYVESSPRDPDALHDFGVVMARKGQFDLAADKFRAALDVDPNRHETWRNLALAHEDAGRPADAEPCLATVCQLRPGDASAHRDLGRLRARLQQHAKAIEALQRAVELEPESAQTHFELGNSLAEVKRHAEARSAMLRAVELDPALPNAFDHLGMACREMGEPQQAITHFREAIRLRPGGASAWNNLGVALSDLGKYEEAIEAYNSALAIAPHSVLAWNNLGNALNSVGRSEAAAAALETAIRLRPDCPEPYSNLAMSYVRMGKNETALTLFDRALRFHPDHPQCHVNRGLQRLLVGDMANGWADYEWRWRLEAMQPRRLNRPRWDGTPLGGKRVLIHWEQGLGDSIQFIRYAKELKNRGAGRVIFEGQAVLRQILSRTPGLDEFVPKDEKLPEFDIYAPLLSLPGQCHTAEDNVPCDVPYVLPDPDLVDAWRPRLDALAGLRVGIVWQGNREHGGDRIRSIPLRLFEAIAKVAGVSLVSLQRGYGSEQAAQLGGLFEVATFDGVDDQADGFLRTAAIISNLDLVISADTAVAHLAGAMGAPVWICLAMACDWRWLRHREDTPWYPTARLFRQRAPDDWAELFTRMAAALRERIAANPRRAGRPSPEARARAAELLRAAHQLVREGNLHDARGKFEQALQADPDCAEAHHDLGAVLGKMGLEDRAIECFRRAIELRPSSGSAYGNLGLAFLRRGQVREAVAHLRSAVRLGAGSIEVYNNLGQAQMKAADARSAEQSFIKALQLQPDFAAAHRNLARALLIQGKFEQGWLEYEWRFKCHPAGARKLAQPRWAGVDSGDLRLAAQEVRGKPMLLYADAQAGLGDTIQFVRYASLLKQAGATVIVECQPGLVPLLSRCPFIDRVIPAGAALPAHDAHAALLSMPTLFGTTIETIPASVPYLSADPALVEKWSPKVKSLDGLRVGIVWQGDPRRQGHGERRIPPEQFRRLAGLEGVKLISLQKGMEGKSAGAAGSVVDFGADLDAEAFMDTAAIMAHLDLVITADTAVAHLAGALGVPTWLVLPLSCDFRWLLDRADSPWYPTLRIFRQDRSRDWEGVFQRVAAALRQRIAELAPASAPASIPGSLQAEGARLFSSGDLAGAADRFARAVELRPDSAAAHHDLAAALSRQRRFDEAIAHFRRAIELDPSTPAVYANLALALIDKGDYAAAVAQAQAGLRLLPDSPQLHLRMGVALIGQKQFTDSERRMRRAIELHDGSPEAHYWLGESLWQQDRFTEAAECFRRAAGLRPEWAEAHNRLGMSLAADGAHAAAAEALSQAVRLRPGCVEPLISLGTALAGANRLDEATDALQRAVYLRPADAECHRHLATVLLLRGRYEQGWLEYEWRLRGAGAPQGPFPGTRWDGMPLTGKSILLVAEQGLGETLQFIRYAKLARERGAKVIVECQRPLTGLLSRCPFIDQVIPQGSPYPSVDFHIPLMSMPAGFGTTLQTVPAEVPYVWPDPALVEKWRKEIRRDDRRRIGIAWHGGPNPTAGRAVSIPLKQFQPLGGIGDVELISLQQGEGIDELDAAALPVRRLPQLEDPAATVDDIAAIIANLDAVVSCDAAIVHLAGAMAVPVYLALGAACDWRWMRERSDTPWYPTVRLFRQETAGDWSGLLGKIAEAFVGAETAIRRPVP